jgi:carbon-monoxide dehydrogenase iron sulfur subunit
VLIDPDKCINCASCAMACPFGVLRFHEDREAPPGKVTAVKCDNCEERQDQGLIPACVEACLPGALTFEEPDQALKRKTDQVSRSVWLEGGRPGAAGLPEGLALLNAVKKAANEINRR